MALYSWSGIGQGTVANDPLDWLFKNTGPFFDGPSDGLVPRCSSHFGRVIRDDYVHNHLDEINWTFGLVPEYETPSSPSRRWWCSRSGSPRCRSR